MTNYMSDYTGLEIDAAIANADALATAVTDVQTALGITLGYRDTAAGHASSATASASAAAATAAGIAGFDLDAIAETKGVTMVAGCISVFKMPLWLQTATSWYRETLNTATRGARQDMPTVLVVIATATTVTLYDGDDPALPMWMVFNQGHKYALHNAAPLTSVSCLNGLLLVGCANGVGNLAQVNFAADVSVMQTTLTTGYYVRNAIALRNTAVDAEVTGYFSAGLVNRNVNNISMTILPGAPSDPRTGLAIPTIAVFTAGGISVIDGPAGVGTIVDVVYTGAPDIVYGSATPDRLTFVASNGAVISSGYPTADVSSSSYSALAALLPLGTSYYYTVAPLTPLGKTTKLVNSTALASSSGLTLLDKDAELVSYVTSSYNTGWMRNPASVLLCSTDTASLVASTVFDVDFSLYADQAAAEADGWVFGSGWSLTAGQAVHTGIASKLQKTISNTAGAVYAASVTGTFTSGGAYATLQMSETGTLKGGLSNGVTDRYYTANDASQIFEISVSATGTVSVDAAYLKLADADRSVNNKGLIVNGTITRTAVATGAEKIGYGPFSASNYLEQPYNSNLDFGTGDFTIFGWFKTAVTGADYILHRATAGESTDVGFFVYVDASGYLSFSTKDTSTSSVTGTISVATDTWRHFAMVRKDSGVTQQIYLEGVLHATATVTARDITGTDESLFIGCRADQVNPFAGDLADIIIEPTAWSAEDIAKKYRDELPNFQDGAACTLYSTSDAVTALAHDEVTWLDHAGTSAGRSVFSGLTRVANTATAVTTMISATDGLIIEQ